MKNKNSLLIVILLLSFSCAAENRVTFLTEEFWWQGRTAADSLDYLLELKAFRRGYFFNSSVSSSMNYLSSFEKLGEGGRNNIVILGPFVSSVAEYLAEKYPDRYFAALRRYSDAEPGKNLFFINFDRDRVYNLAGRLTGGFYRAWDSFLSNQSTEIHPFYQNLLSRIKNSDLPAAGLNRVIKMGILRHHTSEEADAEIEAFKRGFLSAGGGPAAVLEREITDLNNRAEIKTTLEELQAEGCAVVLLRLYHLNSYCINQMKQSGMFFIGDEISYSGRALFSIEENWLKTLDKILDRVEMSPKFAENGDIEGVTGIYTGTKRNDKRKIFDKQNP